MSLMNSRFTMSGAWAGAIGGCVAGALGGAFGPSIETMVAPPFDEALRAAVLGAVVWGLVGSLGGAIVGLFGGWRKRRAAFVWAAMVAGWASLIGVVETAQTSAVRGALAFALALGAMTA